MVDIVTDSTADLSPELVARHGVRVVPLSFYIAGRTYADNGEVQSEELFRLVSQTGDLPKTSAPAVHEYTAAFEGLDEVIYVGISSRLSAAMNNACIAAESFPAGRVRLVDSLTLSTGIGLLVLHAADLRDAGATAAEIERSVRDSVPKVRAAFVVDTLRYLYLGGRCTALQSLAGSVLKIRPVIEVLPDGTLDVREKLRGTRRRALQSLLDDYAAHVLQMDHRRVFVTHTGCDEDAEFLKRGIIQLGAAQEVLVTRAGCVVSSHCGPDTIGVLYLLR